MVSPRQSDRIGLAVSLAIAVAVCAFAWRAEKSLAGEWGFPLDDAWIHAQVARNIAQGHGFCFNAGETAQPSSGPLWTVLVAIGFRLFGVHVWVAKILSALCFLGCVWMAGRVARRLSEDRVAEFLAALLAALCAPLAWHGL